MKIRLTLTAKLVLIMLLLSFLSLGVSFYLYARTEKALVQEMEQNINELSNAISVSVEELTSPERTTEKRLQDYVKRLETRGVKEISIVSNEKEVIASSNPHRVGARLDPKRKDLLITAKLGDQLPSPTQKAYNLLVPIVVEGEQLGYAHISMIFDDYEKLIESHYLNRLAATLVVFSLGIIVSIFLSSRYTRPIYQIMAAAKKVASGDLSQTIPVHKGNDEINELTESFNEMVEKLRQNKALEERLRETEHFTALGQLASGIAHEIRNPLNFISLSIDHLKEKAGRASPDEKERMSDLMSSIKSEIFRLNNMVEDILKYGRPLRLQIEWMNLNLLLKEVISLANQKAIEQGVEIEYVPGEIPLIEGDSERIKTCLMNIVANGIQAMPTGGKLAIRALRPDPSFVVLEIIDNGPGISPDDLKKVFQPYFTTKQLGIGLGLALTKRIIEEHHGKIEISSEIERGSGFASSSEGFGGNESAANRPLNIIEGKGTKVVLTLPVRYESPLFLDGVQKRTTREVRNGLSARDAVNQK
ncbi:MAG: HAMP domain-containing protein [Nitrospirae bacterium]|nr:HAMP domain-containing protein [Nitrospirota bacterium]